MQSSRYARVRALFDAALDLPDDQQVAFVRKEAESTDIANEVIRLLGYGGQAKVQTQQPLQMLVESENQAMVAGRVLGKYELFELIGEGGMGQVYRARRVDDTEQWVALKVMRRSALSNGFADRFRAERQILARLNHPGIAHFIDTDTDSDGNPYVVMELVQGQTLLQYADAKALDTRERIALFRQLLAALIYAHRELVIHRDIKAANVLVRADGVLKLLDFGIAKLLANEAPPTSTHDRLYTPLSAAPEQIRGEPCSVATDVYALGVLLYEFLCGKPIFDFQGKTPGAFEQLILSVPPPDMRARAQLATLGRDIPKDLERIVAKALRKEPERRYGSVEQLDADLDSFLQNKPVSVADHTPTYRLQKFLARHRIASAFALLSVLAIASGVVVAVQQYRQIISERDRANLALSAMKEAFIGADPSGEAGGNITARQVLERSANALMPLIQQGEQQFLDLATTLLEVQLSLNLIQDAEQTRLAMDAAKITDTARLCLLSARLLAEQQKLAAAKLKFGQCQPSSEADQTLAKIVEARIVARSSDHLKALSLYRDLANELPISHPAWNDTQQRLAIELTELRQYDAAFELLDNAEAKAKERLPEEHPEIAALKVARLRALTEAGQFDETTTTGRRALQQLQPIYGDHSAVIGRINSLIALGYTYQGKYDEAVRYHQRAVRSFRMVFGPEHRSTLRMEMNQILNMTQMPRYQRELPRRFESLMTRSDQKINLPFRQFIAVEYAKWMARNEQFTPAIRMLTAVAEPPYQLDTSDGRLTADYFDWLNYAYWASECASNDAEDLTRELACEIIPSRLDATCFRARKALCNPRPREIIGLQ